MLEPLERRVPKRLVRIDQAVPAQDA